MKKQVFQEILTFKILRFLLTRWIKSKSFWIIFSLMCAINIIILWSLSAKLVTFSDNSLVLLIIFTNAAGICFIAIFNIYSLIQIYIKDQENGIYSLEKRMGVSKNNYFFTRLFANKIIIWFWFLLSVLLFLFFVGIFTKSESGFFFSKVLPGLFTQVIFDLVFSGIVLILVATKNIKLSSSLAGALTAIFMIFPFIGMIQFTLFDANPSKYRSFNLQYVDYTHMYDLEQIQEKYPNGVLDNLYKDFKNNSIKPLKLISSNCDANQETNQDCIAYFEKIDFQKAYDQGVFLDLENIVNNNVFSETEDKTYKYVTELTEDFKNTFSYQFFTAVNNRVKNQGDFSKSWFNGKNISNYNSPGQLGDTLAILSDVQLDGVNKHELLEITNLLNSYYSNYFTIKDTRVKTNPNDKGLYWLTLSQEKISFSTKHNLGTKMMIYMLSQLFNVKQKPIWQSTVDINLQTIEDLKKYNFKLKFMLNPFTTLILTSLYSGNNNYLADNKIHKYDFMLPDFRTVKFNFVPVDSQGENIIYKIAGYQDTERPFNIAIIYLIWSITGIALMGIGYGIFLRKAKI
ncbi:hypothetical protein SSYRP_v1c07030 [Spiroplasma syrphidicola EA-1]|uniref:Uncharacterized protein n=1 Tax=Spiroplasma syrphidicola EA-1 TaxID=1276229 RepID=R4U6P8_9MOLU|nr:hypothetical protein [Spiroplasma syrphidicola]AGM26293.1 hypothetical protein SSYRP_v1c07030 [Spiroplasma syrphidicola EA-1]